MPALPSPLRLDPELTRSAEPVAARMSRSVPEQIAHWARIGRELERSPDVSMAQIRQVLDGAADYDALPRREQAVVRAAWMERIEALGSYDLRAEFAAKGHAYAVADETGRVTIHEPPAIHEKPARYAAKARKRNKRGR